MVPTNRFSDVAKNYLEIRPPEMVPNIPGSGPRTNYYRAEGGQTNPWNKYSVKIDHTLTQDDRISFIWLDSVWETKDLAQGDWRVSPKLTLNLGLRYEYTFPIRGGAEIVGDSSEPDGFSNFDPDVPNPGAGGLPGAMVFTGQGPGRTGSSDPFPGWKWAFSPRIGIAYQLRPGTVLRLNGGRSFAAVKTTGGSTHYVGLIGNYSWSSADNNINHFPMMLDEGLPFWPPPPFLEPDVANGQSSVDYWTSTAGRLSEYWTYGLDVQQELPSNTVFTLGYTGTKGVHLASGMLAPNQIDPRYRLALDLQCFVANQFVGRTSDWCSSPVRGI